MKKRKSVSPLFALFAAAAALATAGIFALAPSRTTAANAADAADAAEGERWYTAAQAAAGSRLYAANCLACHGENAAGAANWQQKQADGSYPPPPLNGAGHAWHHSLDALRRSIEEGGAAFGGVMPGFGGVLGAEERDAIIAYIQTLWPDEIYRVWAEKVEGKHHNH